MPWVGNFRFRAVRKFKSTGLGFAELSRRLKSLNMSRYPATLTLRKILPNFPQEHLQNQSELLIATSIETIKS